MFIATINIAVILRSRISAAFRFVAGMWRDMSIQDEETVCFLSRVVPMMIQPAFLHAFASTAVRLAAAHRAAESAAHARCGEAGSDFGGTVDHAMSLQPVDELELSKEALVVAEQGEALRPPGASAADEAQAGGSTTTRNPESAEADAAAEGHGRRGRGGKPAEGAGSGEAAVVSQLTDDERRQVSELKSRDREVRAHEQAHLSAAGPYAQGSATFEYQNGPDGRQYAIGGEVSIDTSPVSGDPAATIQKAQQIRAAALAPASPSGQDHRVAAAATQMETQARAELAQQGPVQQSAAAAYAAPKEQSAGTLLDLVA